MGRRGRLPLTIAALLCGVAVAGCGGEGKSADRKDVALLPGQSSWHACELLSLARARQFVGGVAGPWRKTRARANQESCTFVKRDASTSVTVSTYPAREFERTVSTLRTTSVKADWPSNTRVAGRRAAFQRRLGYLVKVPGAPVYVQFTFMHVAYLHSDPKLSRRLANEILGGVVPVATPRKLYCSLTGERVL